MKLSIFSMNRSSEEPEFERPGNPTGVSAPPPAPGSRSESQPVHTTDLREQILNRLLFTVMGVGAIVYMADLTVLVRSRQWLTLSVGGLVLAGLILAAVNRRMSYRLRTVLLLTGLLAIGLTTLLADGLYGSGRIFLAALPFLASIFSERRGRIGWMVAGVTALALTGVAMTAGWAPVPELRPETANNSLFAWVVAVGSFSLISIAGTASLGMLLEYLDNSLKQQRELTGALNAERDRLEISVAARTQDLERRLVQIHTAAEISGAISRAVSTDAAAIDRLLPGICDLMRERFNLYYVGIFLIETGRSGEGQAEFAVLKAGTGEAGREMLAAGHRLMVGGDSMIGQACLTRRARIALDTGAEAVRFNNPYLPRTRSELALPVVTSRTEVGQTRALGALTIQSTQESAFDQDDVTALQGIADSLASAIENASLFARMQASLDEIETLHRQYLEGAWSQAAASSDLSYTFDAPETAGLKRLADGDSAGALQVPIRLRDQVIGSLVLTPNGEGEQVWTPDQQALVQAVASQAALALENARLLEETQRTAETERQATSITSKLWSTSDMEMILRTTLSELGATLEAQEGWIELWPAKSMREENDARA